LGKNHVEFTCFGENEAEGCEVREPLKEARKKRDSFIDDSEGESELVGDGEELFGDDGKRI
jgi:hypothetical protein